MVATQIFFMFIPKIGEDEPILTIIFFKGVGSTTIQKKVTVTGKRGVSPWCFFLLPSFLEDVSEKVTQYTSSHLRDVHQIRNSTAPISERESKTSKIRVWEFVV